MLFNIHTRQWDDELLKLLDVPRERAARGALVAAKSTASLDRRSASAMSPIAGIAGDQQAALFGQTCFTRG